jgi:hypothetical protein
MEKASADAGARAWCGGMRVLEGSVGGSLLASGLVLGVVGPSWTLAFWLVTVGAASPGDALTARWRQQPPHVRPIAAFVRWTQRYRR